MMQQRSCSTTNFEIRLNQSVLSPASKSLKGDERQARARQWEQANDFEITSHTHTENSLYWHCLTREEKKNQLKKKLKKKVNLLW